jgi:hypothetical protein
MQATTRACVERIINFVHEINWQSAQYSAGSINAAQLRDVNHALLKKILAQADRLRQSAPSGPAYVSSEAGAAGASRYSPAWLAGPDHRMDPLWPNLHYFMSLEVGCSSNPPPLS